MGGSGTEARSWSREGTQPPLSAGDDRFQRGAAHVVAPHHRVNERIRQHLAE
jgi:hypothetical protein